jgi:TetR/AcrR family transcriptional repressor of nem operon
MDLFHAHGVNATSPRQIMEASKTGQGQLYHYFGSKAGLVEAVLDVHQTMIASGRSPIKHALASWADVDTWFDMWAQMSRMFQMARVCPVAAVARDVTSGTEALQEAARLPFRTTRDQMAPFFQAEIDAGRLAVESAEGLADWCMATMQGALLLAQVYRDPAPMMAAFGHAKRYIRALRESESD